MVKFFNTKHPFFAKIMIDKAFGQSLPFISDPYLELIDRVGMKNGDVAYRGYALIVPDGQVLLKQLNDYWGQELD